MSGDTLGPHKGEPCFVQSSLHLSYASTKNEISVISWLKIGPLLDDGGGNGRRPGRTEVLLETALWQGVRCPE